MIWTAKAAIGELHDAVSTWFRFNQPRQLWRKVERMRGEVQREVDGQRFFRGEIVTLVKQALDENDET